MIQVSPVPGAWDSLSEIARLSPIHSRSYRTGLTCRISFARRLAGARLIGFRHNLDRVTFPRKVVTIRGDISGDT